MHLNVPWGNMPNLICQVYSIINHRGKINDTNSHYSPKVCSSSVNSASSDEAVMLAHTPWHSPHPGEQSRPAL